MANAPVRYPIGIQSFESLNKLSYLYIDKTDLIYNLVSTSKCVFLSRPRRFGKSLLLSTIQAYFEGKKELFKGLAIEELEMDWRKYPVLTLRLAEYDYKEEKLESIIDKQFIIWEQRFNIEFIAKDLSSRFRNIIQGAYEATEMPVVILVDEYDKPIISSMDNPDKSNSYRQLLMSIYVNVKDLDEYIRFTMMTGFSSSSTMTTYRGLNSLYDISFSRKYSTICGITEEELRADFKEGIEKLAIKNKLDFEGAVQLLKANYDGYHFTNDCPDIYNPFSLLRALDESKIGSYWFQSVTPESIVEQIQQSGEFLPEMFNEEIEESMLSYSDITESNLIALLYKTGYLTIMGSEERRLYHLGIPNMEVREGLFNHLAKSYFNERPTEISKQVREVRGLLEEKRIDEAMDRLQTFMAGIPYEMADKATELHYENNLFIIFMLIGVNARPEWHTSAGRIDLLLRMNNFIYIIELKRDGTPEEALEQISKMDYARQFKGDKRPIINLGVSFSTKTRNITAWKFNAE